MGFSFMYLDFYKFRAEPFHITPDPDFLYLSPSHKEALAAIIYGVQQRKGFITITGEVGLGKTTIVRSYLERYDPKSTKTVLVFNANVSFEGLLRVMYRELGLTPPDLDPYEMVQELHTLLIQEYQNGVNVVLIIDEAQNMPVETLENLRMLSNLESTKDKLLQIILIGQPELENLLNQHRLRQLKQRIAIRTKLRPLTPDESLDYIRHRLSLVQTQPREIFTRKALHRIVRESQGIPRKINIICDNALITGFGYGHKTISAKIIQEVVDDLAGRFSLASKKKRYLLVAGLCVALLIPALLWRQHVPRTAWVWAKENIQRLHALWVSVTTTSPPSQEVSQAPFRPTSERQAGKSDESVRANEPRVVKPLPPLDAQPADKKAAEPQARRLPRLPSGKESQQPDAAPMLRERSAPSRPAAMEGISFGDHRKASPSASTRTPALVERLVPESPESFWPAFSPSIFGFWYPETFRLSNLGAKDPSRAAAGQAPLQENLLRSPPPQASKGRRSPTPDVPQPDPGRIIDWILNKRSKNP
ncbi:AAA family ATPase [Desulfosoma sp.]|uniref:AAA family ATPase n=1 Tax=Desulfosoma sp. TaxID=2603217 RepID=UPI00404B6BBC